MRKVEPLTGPCQGRCDCKSEESASDCQSQGVGEAFQIDRVPEDFTNIIERQGASLIEEGNSNGDDDRQHEKEAKKYQEHPRTKEGLRRKTSARRPVPKIGEAFCRR